MDCNMKNLADTLNNLTWAEMVRVSGYISDTIASRRTCGEPVDRDAVAEILSDMADDICREVDAEQDRPE